MRLHGGKELSALDRESYVRLYGQRAASMKQKQVAEGKLEKNKDQQQAETLKQQIAQLDAEIKRLSDEEPDV